MATPDLAEFRAESRGKGYKEGPCRLGEIHLALDKKRGAQLTAAMADKLIYNKAIETVLRSWGHPVSDTTVSHHRTGRCRCGRNA